MLDRFKKDVGFIKNSSSKKNIDRLEASPHNSSDSFSSFDYNPNKERNEDFSPYKHPIHNQESFRPHSNPKLKEQNNRFIPNKQFNPPKFTNQVLRNNFTKEIDHKKEKTNLLEKRSNKQVIPHQQAYLKQMNNNNILSKVRKEQVKDQFEQQLSLSNIHKFQKSKQNKEEFPEQEIFPKKTRQILKYKQYLEQSASSSDQDEQDHDFEHLPKKQTVKQIKQKNLQGQIQNQEELITEYDKLQFKDKSIKRAILQLNKQKLSKGKGPHETRGGICFQLDTKQFKGNSKIPDPPRKKKKKKQVDSRLLLLKRRQVAKMYDRQARVKVFGYY